KARLVAQVHKQEEGIDYDEVFSPVAKVKVIRLSLAFASYMNFLVYHIDVKSAFLYGTIEEEVYVSQPSSFVDPEFPEKVYKVEKALCGLHQGPRAWYETLSTYLLDNRFHMGQIDKTLFIKKLKGDILLVQFVHAQDFKFGQKFPICMPDYTGASLDRKSTTGGRQFLGSRLISWQCKKRTVVANSTTEAEYITASHCCGQVLWIQNQMLDYGYNFMQTKIHVDNESAICVIKSPVYHSKTKHIEIRHHFIRDSYEKRRIEMVKIHTDNNVADLLTKAFDTNLCSQEWIQKHVSLDCIDRHLGKFKRGREVVPLKKVGDEVVHKELGDRMERAATTASSLKAKQDNAYTYHCQLKGNAARPKLTTARVYVAETKVKKVNDEVRIQTLVDGKRVNIKESSIRRILRLDDTKGTSCLTNTEIFKGLARMGFVQLIINHQLGDMTHHKDTFDTPSLTKKVFANMKRVGTGFSREVTLLIDNMLVQAPKEVGILQADAQPIPIPIEPSISKPQKKHKSKRKQIKEPEVPPTESQAEHNVPLPLPSYDLLPSEEENMVLKELKGVHSTVDSDEPVMEKEESSKHGRKIADINVDVEINLEKVQDEAYNLDLDHQKKVLSTLDVNDEEPASVKEVLKVVTAAKLITKVVTTAGVDVNAASVQDTLITATEATKVIVEVPKPRKRRDEEVARQLVAELNADINWNVVIEQVKKENQSPREISKAKKEVKVEISKREGESLEQEIAKKQKMEQETEELKKHLQIVPDDDDNDVYADATPLASKIPIVDYKIHTERNKPYFKIIRAGGNHRFEKTEPKNYTDNYLLNTLKIMFEKPNVEANVWKDQKGKYGLAKVKNWKLFDSYGVHHLNLSTTQIFLLIEKMYPLTHFTLEQMVNDVRLEVDYESKMSLELLRLVRR
nr:retrotransposon protein, putative, unclassified [Tanacetum cinerariifolium]